MSQIEIVQYIIIPIVAAFLGGIVTFLGVLITIRFQQKQNKNNIVLLNKPYLKILKQKGNETVFCRTITNEFDVRNMDYEKTKVFYNCIIDTIYLKNSSNADCILKEFIVDGNTYSIDNVLILKNEVINLETTRNFSVNTETGFKSINIRVEDVLGNSYYFDCIFKMEFEHNMRIIQEYDGKKFTGFVVKYIITNISLPKTKKEFLSKKM